jgi:hypothetical protein
MLCKRWRNTNDELVPGSFIFVPGFRDKKYQSKTKRGQMPKWTGIMNKFATGKQPWAWWEYVQVFRGMFVKLGITGKESSAFGSFAFPYGEGNRGFLVSNLISIF